MLFITLAGVWIRIGNRTGDEAIIGGGRGGGARSSLFGCSVSAFEGAAAEGALALGESS